VRRSDFVSDDPQPNRDDTVTGALREGATAFDGSPRLPGTPDPRVPIEIAISEEEPERDAREFIAELVDVREELSDLIDAADE
jgi:hypothetical protein